MPTHAKKPLTLIPLFEELIGERVVVRPYRESDAQATFEAHVESRDALRPWEPFADWHQTVDEKRDLILQWMAQWLLRENLTVGIWDRATGRFLGSSGLRPHKWEIGYFEIGYWIRTSETGKGYVTEAVKLLIDYAFEQLQANRIEIRCDPLNERSAAVARRLGFVQEGRLRNNKLNTSGQLRDTLVFSLTPADRQSQS
ncbi:GNAT family N-acetyltransferase [Dictyobacter arantiisoli]|uniref:Ribosomal-protein-serine acetyltransferase n=1 Tax=Dictyobacter arantiisoli TaxID=2014874 RepID=A0A5A5T7B1_9CHLR|nr:GNAT family N-acetyltransferase [Dictyobacter arantiisoli]GCF06883.1 ribosomal-protein-serine acetyltransferase [Dictyobacter arantiisoli]